MCLSSVYMISLWKKFSFTFPERKGVFPWTKPSSTKSRCILPRLPQTTYSRCANRPEPNLVNYHYPSCVIWQCEGLNLCSLELDSPVPQMCRLSQRVSQEYHQLTPTLLEHEQLVGYQSSESGTSLNILSKLRAGIKPILSDRALCGSGDDVVLIRWQGRGEKGCIQSLQTPR